MADEPVRLRDDQVKEGTACAAARLLSPAHPSAPSSHSCLAHVSMRREFYRRRFESSVLGQHSMLPPPELAQHFKSGEEPAPYPSGPNTSFLDPTPMPRRFMAESLPAHNARHANKKTKNPTYSTSASEVGELPIQESDFPIRWYGLRGEFTNAFFLGGKGPKSKVNTGLSTAMDRSDFHHEYDQGWSGHMGLRDYNIPSLTAATFVGKPGPRR